MLSEIGDYEGTKKKIENSYKIRDHFLVKDQVFILLFNTNDVKFPHSYFLMEKKGSAVAFLIFHINNENSDTVVSLEKSVKNEEVSALLENVHIQGFKRQCHEYEKIYFFLLKTPPYCPQ